MSTNRRYYLPTESVDNSVEMSSKNCRKHDQIRLSLKMIKLWSALKETANRVPRAARMSKVIQQMLSYCINITTLSLTINAILSVGIFRTGQLTLSNCGLIIHRVSSKTIKGDVV